jgi:nitrous oxide reductase accessory protein NosL
MKLFKTVIVLAVIVTLAMTGTQVGEMKKGMKMPANYRMVPIVKVQILQDGKDKMFCTKCGMTLPMFYRTNHAATVDGKVEQFCSIYCLVEAMESGAKVSDVKVVDNSTLRFIDASKAFYVVGSSKPATMAKKVSKYAFGTKAAAEKFAVEFGGKVMGYEDTLAGAKKDFQSDSKAKKMRQAKAAKKGEMIYKKKCKPIEQKFASVAEAKSYIKANNVCGEIKGKALQGVGLYLMSR